MSIKSEAEQGKTLSCFDLQTQVFGLVLLSFSYLYNITNYLNSAPNVHQKKKKVNNNAKPVGQHNKQSGGFKDTNAFAC